MRYCGLIILAFLVSCKGTQVPTSTAPYSEDLSIHRPELKTSVDKTQVLEEEYTPTDGHIKTELDSIMQVSLTQNMEGKIVNGYIIQVYTGNNRSQANEIFQTLDEYFPDLNAKISYHQPNFRVEAGQFLDRLTAHRIYKDVKEEFPNALLVPDRFTMSYE